MTQESIYYKKYLNYKRKYIAMQDMIGGLDLKTFLTNRINKIKNLNKINLANLLLEKETQMSNNSVFKNFNQELFFYIKHETKFDLLKDLIKMTGVNITIKNDDMKTIVLSKRDYIKLFIWLFSDIYNDMANVRIENNPPTIKFDTPLSTSDYFRRLSPRIYRPSQLFDSPVSPVSIVSNFTPVIYERPYIHV